ncbi:MAG: trypsin-like serine protease [Moraxellaceae bacterium]|nr:trypsin-like serine protease [Pseudobdellovibrionaceae bacterium]
MKNSQFTLIILALFALNSMSCADRKPSSAVFDSVDSGQIVGGELLKYSDSAASSVVFISTENDEGHNQICTGTFIAKNLILTAAHCIARDKDGMSVSFRGKDFLKTRNIVDIPIAEVYRLNFSELYEERSKKGDTIYKEQIKILNKITGIEKTKIVRRDDLGIIVFAGGLPAEAKIALFPQDGKFSVPQSNTQTITAVGYGRSNGVLYSDNALAPNGEMILRHKALIISTKELDPSKNTFRVDQFMNKGGVCYGDSGGPAIITDPVTKQNIVIGVASQVLNERNGLGEAQQNADYCYDESLYINMYFYKQHLRKALNAAIEKKNNEKLALKNENKLPAL